MELSYVWKTLLANHSMIHIRIYLFYFNFYFLEYSYFSYS